MLKRSLLLLSLLALLLAGCQPQAVSMPHRPLAAPARGAGQPPSPTPQPTLAPAASGPETYPSGINPLTGLAVKDPQTLVVPPAMISVTNFPVSARPQAGLSFSSHVFEMYIGYGMTRYLAVFYGDFPSQADVQTGSDRQVVDQDLTIGPVRSGRLPYESLRKLYSGFLVMSSAAEVVKDNLSQYVDIFGNDADDINSAMIRVTRLQQIAAANQKRLGDAALRGLKFDPLAPTGGQAGKAVWIPFSYLNQVFWRYDAASGAYLRYQDNADGKTFALATDRLNNQPLTYENVIILFANHKVYRPTLIDLDLLYMPKMPALLFRDGQAYPIYWTTKSEAYEVSTGKLRPIRFIDAQGNPFPLKPGQTWVEIVPQFTPYFETVDADYLQMRSVKQPGSGVWTVNFSAP